jgi:antitoxin (DNA-binding transcriptional repressor) of toxin-antitoxin stability system
MLKHIIHVSEAEAASNLAALLARVRAGTEVVIEHDAEPVAILHGRRWL